MTAPRHLRAQLSEVRGTVTDSATRAPVSGAVVMLLDAAGATLFRVLTSDRGVYRMLRPGEATQLRVVRLGFQPATVPLSTARPRVEGGYDLDVRLTVLARALQSVDISAARGCPARPDRAGALALLDQARSGLLASVVAREKDPPKVQVLRFERVLDGDGLNTVRQVVRVDSSAGATTSFAASQSASGFISNGFRSGTDGEYTYYSPDAEVLLAEAFQNGYCFGIAAAQAQRATQVGLHFAAAGRRAGRVDIDGTLWIDTAARALVDIDFRYVGIDAMAEGLGAGGRIAFRALPNGLPFIERWQLRLIGANPNAAPGSVAAYVVREVGGELAEARWSDGRTWQAPLATAHLTAVSPDGRGVGGAQLRLIDTDYRSTTDANGRATIHNVLPGPYAIEIDDPALRPLHLTVPTGRTFVAQRGSSILSRVEVTGGLAIARQRCNRTDAPKRDETWLLGRAVTPAGAPLADVRWQVFEAEDGKFRARTDIGTTASHGIIALCRGLDRGVTIEVVASHANGDTVRVRRTLDEPLTIVPLVITMRTIATSRATAAPSGPTITIAGTVTDSVSGRVIADARVSVLGTPYEGATDDGGQFVIGGVRAGPATIEVSTPFLDSLGVVARRSVTLAESMTPLKLFAPSVSDALSMACGANADASSLIVGKLASRTSPSVVLSGYRIVAEWEADTSTLLATDSLGQSRRAGWATTTPDITTGTWRLCGVPAGRAITLRAEAERMFAGAAAPLSMMLAPSRRLARADVVLDSSRVAPPTFSGAVLADSAGTPIENAEIILRDLGRSVLTDRRGQFRFGEVPEGPHLVNIRAVGYAPWIGTLQSTNGRALDHRVALTRVSAAQALAPVAITASGAPEEFEERRALQLGSYITRAELDRTPGRRFSEVMSTVRGFGNVQGNGNHAYVVGKRAPTRMTSPMSGRAGADGDRNLTCGGAAASERCVMTTEDLAMKGYYCPTHAERLAGLPQCACFARVYVDDRLMNSGKPTEPFDVNTLQLDQIAGVEFYASVATTPSRYSQLDGVCGVMLIWLRRA